VSLAVVFKIVYAQLLIAWAQQYLLDRVLVDCDTECWLWMRSGDGRYGHAYLLGTRIKAQILSFVAFGGKYNPRKIHDHQCNRTMCCNPKHIEPAAQSQNMKCCFAVGGGRTPFRRSET
jgi:hypothetical protein